MAALATLTGYRGGARPGLAARARRRAAAGGAAVNLWPQPTMDNETGITFSGEWGMNGGVLLVQASFELSKAQVTSLAEPIVAGATYSYAFDVTGYQTLDLDTLRLTVGDQVLLIDHDGAYAGTLTMGGAPGQTVMFRDTDGVTEASIDNVVIMRV